MPAVAIADFTERAAELSRGEFVAACPYYFLVGLIPSLQPSGPRRTTGVARAEIQAVIARERKLTPISEIEELDRLRAARGFPPARAGGEQQKDDDDDLVTRIHDLMSPWATDPPPPARGSAPQAVALAVRKVQETFPSMITVGRTANNDLVVAMPSVSKFHAYFRLLERKVELYDAGSSNGTWIGAQRLAAKSASAVLPGDVVRLAEFRFLFLTAGDCWDWLRAPSRI